MFSHILNKMRQLKSISGKSTDQRREDLPVRNTIETDIERLYVFSRKEMWAVLIFLAGSMMAYYFRDQTLTGCLSASFRAQLGSAPPEILIDILQIVSTFSSLILIAGRIYNGRLPGNTWVHLGFRLMFYPLYFIADCMGAHFDFVFVSGLIVLALQHYNFWNYSSLEMDDKMDSKVMG